MPDFEGRNRGPSQVTAVGKRAVDVVLGSLFALIALPFVAILALALLVVLRANPFFVQARPGHDGRSFRILKLRTLPPSTPRYASKHELKIGEMSLPRLCTLLRRTHLDELPQLLLVPLGAMSLVGPRPRLPDDVEAVDARFDSLRRTVRPGCTGLWQISTATHEVSTGAPRFDLFYLRHGSVRFDIWIMLRTLTTIAGLTRPVEVDDVPAWVRGRGFVPSAAFIVAVKAVVAKAEPVTVPTPTPAIEAHAVQPLPGVTALVPNAQERILAEA